MKLRQFVLQGPLPRINRKYVPAYSRASKKSYMRLSKEWEDRFGLMIIQLRGQAGRFTTSDKIDLHITQAVHPRTDSDAVLKGLFDALEHSGIIENDNQIQDIYVERGPFDGQEILLIDIIEAGRLLPVIIDEMLKDEVREMLNDEVRTDET